ncbi:MAG: MFS transporter [Clostridiales Family XIII bacterium]|jgi:MFS family permease|nr:MFS transporter [Clostridiales Family XIII bacterium]
MRKESKRTTLTIVLITSFLTSFSLSSLNIAIPIIGEEFHGSAASLNWILIAFTLCTLALAIPFGKLARIRGKHGILNVGILAFMVANVSAVFAPSLDFLIALRILQGIGCAMIFATNTPILIDAYRDDGRGRVLGFQAACVYAGMSVGPIVGGFLTHGLGWRSIFACTAAISVVSFVLSVFRLPKQGRPSEKIREGIGFGSILLFVVTILLVMYGLTTITRTIASYIILGCGFVCAGFFARHEMRAKNPILDIELLRSNTAFTLSNIAALCNYAAMGAVSYLLSIYLQTVRGYPSDITGLILICQPVLQIALSIVSGSLSDRFLPCRLASIGMGLCAASLCLCGFVNIDSPIAYIVFALVVAGVGYGFFASPNTNAIMSSVSADYYSMASSVLSTMRSSGHVIGMAIITIIMNLMFAATPIAEVPPEQIVRCMRAAFCALAVLCVIGVLLSLKRKS